MAGIIRREQSAAAAAFSFRDLARDAEALRAAARAEAERIVAAARQEAQRAAERIRVETLEAARAEGYAAGHAEGLAAGSAQALDERRGDLAAATRALGTALEQFERERHALHAVAESGLHALALEIARRVCRLELGSGSAAVAANMRNLLELTRHHDDLVIELHPADVETCRLAADDWLRSVGGLGHVEIRAADDAARGTCRLFGRAGAIDASIDQQLERVAAQLLGPSSAEDAP